MSFIEYDIHNDTDEQQKFLSYLKTNLKRFLFLYTGFIIVILLFFGIIILI